MTTDDSDDEPVDDGPSHDDRTGGEWLSTLVHAIDRLGGRNRRQRRPHRTPLDFEISIRSALDSTIDDRRRTRLGRTPDRPRSRWTTDGVRQRETGSRGASVDEYNLTSRRRDDELLVTADVAGVDEDEITAGFRGDELVVQIGGSDLARVEVPWEQRTAEARVRNGILTVRIGADTND